MGSSPKFSDFYQGQRLLPQSDSLPTARSTSNLSPAPASHPGSNLCPKPPGPVHRVPQPTTSCLLLSLHCHYSHLSVIPYSPVPLPNFLLVLFPKERLKLNKDWDYILQSHAFPLSSCTRALHPEEILQTAA